MPTGAPLKFFTRIPMLLANSEIIGILPHTTLLKSPETRIPPPSKLQPVILRRPQTFDLLFCTALQIIWVRHLSIADVKQMLPKTLKFNGMRLGFRRRYVVIPLNRRFHLNTTETPTRNIENGPVPIRQQHRHSCKNWSQRCFL